MMYRLACSVVSSSTLSALEQRHEKRQEGRRDQRKFDDSGAFIAAQNFATEEAIAESAYDACQPLHGANAFRFTNVHLTVGRGALLDLNVDAVKKRLRAEQDFYSTLIKSRGLKQKIRSRRASLATRTKKIRSG
jgi:hypothetical protein